jgi:hypothetical protein
MERGRERERERRGESNKELYDVNKDLLIV